MNEMVGGGGSFATNGFEIQGAISVVQGFGIFGSNNIGAVDRRSKTYVSCQQMYLQILQGKTLGTNDLLAAQFCQCWSNTSLYFWVTLQTNF